MKIVVSSGSYKCDHVEEYVRAFIVDENNYIYAVNTGNNVFLPGYLSLDDNRDDLIEECALNSVSCYDSISHLFDLDYYYLKKTYNSVGKRFSKNCLNSTSYYLVCVDSKKLSDNLYFAGYRFEKYKFYELENVLLKTTDKDKREYLTTVLKLVPENIRCRSKIKKYRSE